MKKYGRTYHLPISPGATSDDKVMLGLDGLMAGDLVVTEKMDGGGGRTPAAPIADTTRHATG